MKSMVNNIISENELQEKILYDIIQYLTLRITLEQMHASESFAAQFESLQPSFNQMDQLILDISKQCDDVADATQALDEEIASKFK